jgi:hypothetical protein
VDEIPRQRERSAENDDIQRQEQLMAERAHPDGDARERRDRQQPGNSTEQIRKCGADRERAGDAADDLARLVRCE